MRKSIWIRLCCLYLLTVITLQAQAHSGDLIQLEKLSSAFYQHHSIFSYSLLVNVHDTENELIYEDSLYVYSEHPKYYVYTRAMSNYLDEKQEVMVNHFEKKISVLPAKEKIVAESGKDILQNIKDFFQSAEEIVKIDTVFFDYEVTVKVKDPNISVCRLKISVLGRVDEIEYIYHNDNEDKIRSVLYTIKYWKGYADSELTELLKHIVVKDKKGEWVPGTGCEGYSIIQGYSNN